MTFTASLSKIQREEKHHHYSPVLNGLIRACKAPKAHIITATMANFQKINNAKTGEEGRKIFELQFSVVYDSSLVTIISLSLSSTACILAQSLHDARELLT